MKEEYQQLKNAPTTGHHIHNTPPSKSMTVREVINDMQSNTYENEKEYQLKIKTRDSKVFKVAYYDWCDTTLVIEEEK